MSEPLILQPIGHTQSGILVKVPLNQTYDEIKIFLEKFFIDDMVDIYCITDFLLDTKVRNSNGDKILVSSLKSAEKYFILMQMETYFGELLQSLNLSLVSERINFGRTLVLPKFRVLE